MSENIYDAAFNGDLATVKSLLERGLIPNVANAQGMFPFMCALTLPISYSVELKASKAEIFKLLRNDMTAIQSSVDPSGNAMLHYVINFGFETLLQELIEEAKLNEDYTLFYKENIRGQKPIHVAILQKNNAIVARLLTQIPHMETTHDSNNRNLIHYMAQYGTASMLKNYCATLPAELLNRYVGATDVDGKTPYQLAQEYNHTHEQTEILQILVDSGAEPHRSFSPSIY